MKNYLKKIKRSTLWKFFLLYLIKPTYDFLWVYIINFHAKIIFIFYSFKKREYFNLNKRNQLIIKNDDRITNIANELNQICTKEFLDKSREEMQAKNINILDIDNLGEKMPELVDDFPGGATRFIQKAQGYHTTICNGEIILRHDEHTGTRSGRVLRH